MKTTLIPLSLIAALAAGSAVAQEATDGAAPADETTETAPDAAQGDAAANEAGTSSTAETGTGQADPMLDTGEPVGETGASGGEDRAYVREESGDWTVNCLRAETGDDPCQLYQLLTGEDGASVAEVSIFKVAGGGQAIAGANFIVPLETLLTQKLTIQVDGGQAKRYDFAFCAQQGCVARIGFTSPDIAAFKAGATAEVTIVPAAAPDRQVTVPMSLTGFTAAYDSIAPSQ